MTSRLRHTLSGQRAHIAALLVLMLVISALILTGCSSSERAVSDDEGPQRVVLNTPAAEKCVEGTSSALSLTGGNAINLADVDVDNLQQLCMSFTGYGTGGWWFRGNSDYTSIAAGTGQLAVHDAWLADGAKYDQHIAVLKGRYLVAVKPAFGESGQCIDVILENGVTIPCIIGDAKGMENAGEGSSANYVHSDGSVVEFEVDPSWALVPGSNDLPQGGSVFNWIPEWKSKVKTIVTYPNSVINGDVEETTTGATSPTSGNASSAGGITAEAAKITTHREWNASDPSSGGHTDPTDDTFSDEFKQYRSYSKDYKPDSSNLEINRDYLVSEDLGDIKSHKYIVLHSTESGSMTGAQVAEMFADPDTIHEKGAHFVVDRDGTVYQCYDMSKVAYHAGAGNEAEFGLEEPSSGPSGMNMNSIGIEIMHQQGEGDYPEEQLKAVSDLIAYIDENTTGGGVTDASTSEECVDGDGSELTGGLNDDELWFKQSEYPQEYDGGYPISSHGCGLCSTTCAIDMLLGKDYDPPTVAKMMRDWRDANLPGQAFCVSAGTAYDPWSKVVAGTFNVEVKSLAHNAQAVKDEILKGHPVIVGGGGTFNNQDGGTRHSNGHLICFYKYDGSYLYCKDSSTGPSVKWSESELNNNLSWRACYAIIPKA